MAIQWGGWAGGSGSNQFRVGFDISVVGTSISVSSYVESKYSINDSVNINYTGIWAGRSVRFAWNQGGGTRFVETLSATGTLGQNYNNGAYLTDVYNGASPSVDTVVSVAAQRPGPPSSGPQPYQILNQTSVRLSWGSTTSSNGADPIEDQLIVRRTSDNVDIHNSIQAGAVRDVWPLQPNTQYQAFARIRNAAGWSDWTSGPYFSTPVDPPAAPSGLTLTRGNDGLHTLSWTNNATSAAPYGALGIDRWDNVMNSWSRIATPTNNPTSFADSTTVADRRYQYRIHSWNGSGVSGFVYTSPAQGLETTPAAPTDCAAVKDGANIVINWTNKASYPVQTEVWHAANGVWDGAPLFTVAAGVATAAHNAPSTAVTHTYRVRAKSSNPVLYSGYSTSGVVQLAAPPNAPTPVGPNGAQNGLTATLLEWVHNPVDSSTQRIFQVRHRVQGSPTWTTPAAVTSSAQSWTLPAGTYANGQVVEWQVMTWGQHATGGAWSATSAFPLSTPPTATINAPGNAWNLPALTMTWGYFDAEGQGQLAWEAELESDGVVLERRAGSNELSTTFARNLPDNTTWKIRLRVRDSTGLYSSWVEQTFLVAYPQPRKPLVSAFWEENSGFCTIQIENPSPPADSFVVTNYAFNPSFETNTTGAAITPGTGATAPLTRPLIGGMFGPAHLRATWAGTATTAMTLSLLTTARAAVVVGQPVTISAYVRSSVATSFRMIYGAASAASAGTVTATNGPFVAVPANTWTRLSLTVPSPTTAFAEVRIGSQGAMPAASKFDVDGVMVDRSATLRRYFDGSNPMFSSPEGYTVNHAWTGTANASTSTASHSPAPMAVGNDVYRSIDGGDWIQIAADIPTQTTIADYTAAAAGTNSYKVVAKSILPSTSESDVANVVVNTTTGGSGWLSAGPGFTTICRAYFNLQVAEKVGRAEKVAHLFAGQTYPTELSGEGLEETVDVKFLSLPNIEAPNHTEWDEWVRISRMSGPHLYRDFEGRYMLVSISPVVGERAHLGAYNGSFTARRIQS